MSDKPRKKVEPRQGGSRVIGDKKSAGSTKPKQQEKGDASTA